MGQREKRSVSLPPELARAVEEAARAEDTTFSASLAQTAAHRLKLEAGRQALAEWERGNGPLTEAELAEGRSRARSSLGRTSADPAGRSGSADLDAHFQRDGESAPAPAWSTARPR